MSWFDRLTAAHLVVTDAVSHYARMQSDRYFVWAEEDSADLVADGKHKERVYRGTTDLFTKQEQDPWAAQFEFALDTYGIAWQLNSVQYEDDTGFVHYEWLWEVVDGKDDH